MTVLLEINDVGVRIHRDGEIAAESPGYVHIDRKTAVIGEAARRLAKLHPTRTEHEFWHLLSRDELKHRNRVARFQADLAYLHLGDLWRQAGIGTEPVLVAVPGDYSKAQISLLLGILRRLEITVRAVVDLAIAASGVPQPGRELLHLDVHLHRSVLTSLQQGPLLERTAARATREISLARLLDAWAHSVSTTFVRHTRFDPMHDAAVEQSLYDQLLGWLDTLIDEDEVSVALEHAGRRYEAALHRRDIVAAAEPIYQLLGDLVDDATADGKPLTIQVSDRAARLPGLRDVLAMQPETEVVELAPEAASKGVSRLYLSREGDEGIPFVTSKPWFDRDGLDRHAEALSSFKRTRPTHVLVGARAHALGESFSIGASHNGANGLILEGVEGLLDRHLELRNEGEEMVVGHLGDGETRINGVPAQPGQRVAAGDRIRLGRSRNELLLIAVEDSAS